MEQFDQLLTCAICLDRYRNPKLLPCQHSFCMEPCMEGLVNYVTRQVKCPECRAEHRIPYQGIQQYPTNVTLQRFLELHIEITGELPDPTSGQVMERCGVCSEKAYVTACSHCDKRVCPDCKEAHLDILRREIARVNNQVRRTLPRLNDALSVIEKNTVHLQTNCANIIEEIDDIYHRLSKALKDRTEFLKSEIEVFLAKELRHLTQLRENLDQEISNFDSNSEFAEKHMGEGAVWDDNELLDAKEIFLRTMEFIRGFECETGDYHRRVRFFIPQDPNQLATTLSTLGELTINASQAQSGNAPQPPQPPTLGPGLMRSKSDHRVAAQFRQAEERYMQTYGSEAGGNEDGPRRYFGDRSNTRFGDSRRGEYGDYESDVPSTDTRRSSRFRSRFMRHLDSGDSDNEPTGRSVRFHDQQGNESADKSAGPQKKERSRVIDTEDATRGPLSGITRFMDSPRVMKRLQEMEQKDKKKDRPSSLSLPNQTANTPAVNPASSPLRRAARQVSEDEIDKIKKQNKSAEAAATETPSATATAAAATATSAAQRKTSSSSQPDTPTSTSSDRSKTTDKTTSRQSSTVEKRDESADKRSSSYSRSQSQSESSRPETTSSSYRTEEPTRAPPPSTKPAPAPFSRTSSSSSVNQDDGERGSNGRSRVTDRFKPSRTSTSSDSSTSAESSKHSSPVRNTGAAFSTDELRSRFGTSRKSSNSPNGETTTSPPSTTTTSTTSSAPRSRFGTVTPAASSTTTSSRFGASSSGGGGSSGSSSSSSASSAAASSSTATTVASAGTRFQSRFLGRAGTPTAEASKGSESSSSSEEDSSASESDSDDDNESAPATSTSVSSTPLTTSAASSSTVRDRELARTDIGPLLARSAQARDTTSSYTSRSSALDPVSTSASSASTSTTSYRRTNPPSVAPPPPSYSSSSTLTRTPTSRFGSVSSAASGSDGPSSSTSRFSDYTPSTGLSRSRTGSALHSTEDMENKYPLTSKYLNRSRANLSTDHSTSSTSASDTSSTYTPRYGGYRSRFLNKSKSSAALAPDREDDEDDAGSESPSQDGSAQDQPSSEASQSAAGSNASPLVAGEERYPSGRSRYAALKDRRSRLARSKSSHDVAPAANGLDNSAEANNNNSNAAGQRSGEVADTGTCPPTNNASQEQAQESGSETGGTGSSLSNWARYLKNKYGPRNKDNATDSSDAESGTQGRVLRKRSLINRPWSPDAQDSNKSDQILPSPVSPTSPANFSFNHYMQKRKVQIKFGTRGSEAGCFTWPRGVAVGPDNNVVVADSSNHRVQVFDVKGRFVKEFGHYGNGEGEFDCLAGVAVNRIGQYIIADRYNHRIQVFDPSGRFLRVFGSQGSTDGKFSYPWGVTTDALGFIYVCDKENHRVQVFQSDGTFVGKFGSLGNRPGQLEHPHYIAVSCTNRVIVSDSNNHRIQVFDVNGKVLSSFGQEGTDDGHFKFPRGVAVDDQGYIIVADSGNNRIQIFSPDGAFIRSFGGWGSGDGEFKGLEGIAVLSNGNIVVCDRENHRIQIF